MQSACMQRKYVVIILGRDTGYQEMSPFFSYSPSPFSLFHNEMRRIESTHGRTDRGTRNKGNLGLVARAVLRSERGSGRCAPSPSARIAIVDGNGGIRRRSDVHAAYSYAERKKKKDRETRDQLIMHETQGKQKRN